MKTINKKILAIAVAAALGSNIAPSYAFPVSFQIDANTNVELNGTTDVDTDSDPNYASASNNLGGYYAQSSANAKGDDTGWIYSTSYGTGGTFDNTSNVTQTVTVTNDTAFDQFIDFTFTVNQGSLSIYEDFFSEVPIGLGEFITAEYNAGIKFNGGDIWSSTATLTKNNVGLDFTTGGTVLGSYGGDSNYYWGAHTDTLGLGVIGAGSSFTIEYMIETHTVSNLPLLDDCNDGYGYGDGYGDYGENGVDIDVSEYGEYGDYGGGIDCFAQNLTAYAQFGDPFDFNGNNVPTMTPDSFNIGSNSVSEPNTPYLLGLGLAGLAFIRRRKDKKTK